MPRQVVSANSDRRAIEQAQEFMLVVGSKVIPALTGTPPSESGEIAAFAVFRGGEVIYRGLVALRGELGVVDSAAELVCKAQNWSTVNADLFVTDRIGKYRADSPEGATVFLARDDEKAMEAACKIHFRDPDGGDAYTTTPFAVFSEKDGHLAGIGVQCMVEGVGSLHSFSQSADYLLGWFEGISVTMSAQATG